MFRRYIELGFQSRMRVGELLLVTASLSAIGLYFSVLLMRHLYLSVVLAGIPFYGSSSPGLYKSIDRDLLVDSWLNGYSLTGGQVLGLFSSRVLGESWVLVLLPSIAVSALLHAPLSKLRVQLPSILYRAGLGPGSIYALSLAQSILYSAIISLTYLLVLGSTVTWSGVAGFFQALNAETVVPALILATQPPLYAAIFIATGRVDFSVLSVTSYSLVSAVAASILGPLGAAVFIAVFSSVVAACWITVERGRWVGL